MKQFLFIFALVAFSLTGTLAQSECFPKKDNTKLVYDEVDLLSKGNVKSLDNKLQEFARSSSNQIVIAIVPDLCGMDRSEFAIELGHQWGVGQDGFDNGIVILVKPTGGQGERHTFIAIGQGLEGAIPDGTVHQIVQNELLPKFKEGDFYSGLNNATNVLMSLAVGEFNSQQYADQQSKNERNGALIMLIMFLFFFGMMIWRTRNYSRVNDLDFWTAFWLLANTGRRHRGTYGDFSGGRGTFGGGGFGGFGGGGFGGGGAGGSW